MGLQYKIIYKKGVDNRAADALSRRSQAPEAECAVISTSTPQWLEQVVAFYGQDSHAQTVMAKLVVEETTVSNFTFKDDLLRYKNRIWIGKDDILQNKLMKAFHCSAVGGHSGVPVTYKRMSKCLLGRA